MAFAFIAQSLQARRDEHLFRQRFAMPQGHGRHLIHQGRQYLNFSGNDYLAMANHPQVIKAAQTALNEFGVGSGGSALVTGYSCAQQALEEYLADWLGFERCMLFTSGFAANNGVLQTLMDSEGDLLVQDKLNHASLIDGGLHCKAKSVRFKHNDMAHLRQRLAGNNLQSNKLVVSEGVFSMDGDSAPLAQIKTLCHDSNSWLMVDDAHGIGVMGKDGRGSASAQGLSPGDIDITMATFGKAVGTTGAFVGGNSDTIEYLLQHCRHYIYSTAMPPAMATATLISLQCLAQESWRRDKLQQLIGHFKRRLNQLGLPDNDSMSAIQPIIIGQADKALAISNQLKQKGIWLTAIRPPTVPINTARLRVTLSCGHEMADIDDLFKNLEQVIP